jgi:hypothetical protein
MRLVQSYLAKFMIEGIALAAVPLLLALLRPTIDSDRARRRQRRRPFLEPHLTERK